MNFQIIYYYLEECIILPIFKLSCQNGNYTRNLSDFDFRIINIKNEEQKIDLIFKDDLRIIIL